MKRAQHIFSIIFIFAIAVFSSSCSENDPKIEEFESDAVAFEYAVEGDYGLDYFIGSPIKFTNTSAKTGAYTWDFGDGSALSNETNATHVYAEPGLYDVILTVEGVGKRTKSILISDIIPVVTYMTDDDIATIDVTLISFEVYVPNPENKKIKYDWIFPEGTLTEGGSPIEGSALENPGKLKFSNVGSQQITLKTTLGDRKLADLTVNVQVGYNKPVKTIYYAVKGGNLMAYKVFTPTGKVKNKPFDLGIKSGSHPFNLIFNDTLLYVLDAGRQFYFIDDQFGNMGDGRVTAVARDGSAVEVIVNNNGGKAFDDPYYGYTDGTNLYFSDRNTGVSRIPLNSRNLDGARATSVPFWVQNTTLGYYGKGIGYGAINSTILKHNNVWWWGKLNSDSGIYRFEDSDVGNAANVPAKGRVLGGLVIRSFAIDATRNILYVAIVNQGLYMIELGKLTADSKLSDLTLIAALTTDTEGTDAEKVFISQLTVDPEDGSVYFGYRAGPGSEKTGLKRYNPKATKLGLETLIEGIDIYGVTINNKKTELF